VVHVAVPSWQEVLRIVVPFAIAWLVARVSGRVAEWIVRRSEARHMAGDTAADTGVIAGMKRRETAISLVRTTVRYLAYGIALLVALGLVGQQGQGDTRITALAGASLLIVLIGFAAQRFLTDILAGFFMFFEGWYAVGDNITIEPLKLQGIVDEVGLRSTRLRSVNGEVVRVHNSQVLATRVQPRGARDMSIEFFVNDEQPGRDLVAEVAQIVPTAPTRFVMPPRVDEVERLDDDLVRIRAVARVAHGREWLAETFLPDLLKERGEGVIVHGPVVWQADDQAVRQFARTIGRGQRTR
jgi:small-conductance mechanosensitive channel